MRRVAVVAGLLAAASVCGLVFTAWSPQPEPLPGPQGAALVRQAVPMEGNVAGSSTPSPLPVQAQRGQDDRNENEAKPADVEALPQGIVHPSVRRMAGEAGMLAKFKAAQIAAGAGTSRNRVADNYSSAVIPFGPGAAEPEPVHGATSQPTVDPMKANPAIASLTQQAQRDLGSLVDAIKAVESK